MAGPPMVIRARVSARLLGIRLLTLDACITAVSDGVPTPGLAAAARPQAARPGRAIGPGDPAEPAGRPAGTRPGTSVARARELVEQGARVLGQERRQR
jgi:hypothetical protein